MKGSGRSGRVFVVGGFDTGFDTGDRKLGIAVNDARRQPLCTLGPALSCFPPLGFAGGLPNLIALQTVVYDGEEFGPAGGRQRKLELSVGLSHGHAKTFLHKPDSNGSLNVRIVADLW